MATRGSRSTRFGLTGSRFSRFVTQFKNVRDSYGESRFSSSGGGCRAVILSGSAMRR